MGHRIGLAAAALLPPLFVGVIALIHPPGLTVEDATRWKTIHVYLLFGFPLLALAPVLFAHAVDRRAGWLVAIPAYVYACTYTALDVLAGIGGGAIKEVEAGGIGIILPLAGPYEDIGGIAFIATCAFGAGVMLYRTGWLLGALPTVAVLAGAWLLKEHHVFPPEGAIAMLLLAIGWGAFWFLLVRQEREATV